MMNRRISRRTVLKGMGASLCLPWLEAMEPAMAAAAPAARIYPTRMAVLYMPNGVNPHSWAPQGVGSAFELSPILSPLQSLRSEILVFSELMNKHSIEGDGHYVKVAPFLTGTEITKTTGSNLRCGAISLDQLVAQHIGNLTPLPSLELSIEPVTSGVDTNVGYTRLYGSHISWSSPTTPVSREINPQLAFDRLFRPNAPGAPPPTAADMSVLDCVKEDATALQASVGQADKQKLDEYFDSVRAVEKRILFDRNRRAQQYHDDRLARIEIEKLGARIRDYYKDPARLSERSIDHTEQVRLMMDIMALAFWTDSTRVSTFMFGNEVSGKNFSFLPGVNGGHHEISHHDNDPKKLAEYEKINRWHIEQYAYLLNRLRSMKEGTGNVLDNSMIMFGGGMKDGNAHSPYNLPIVLAGRANGKLATGRHLAYAKKTPLCDLYRGMAIRMGIPAEHFGDSDGELAGLADSGFAGVKST